MVTKKIDNRIRVMIENGVKLGHRTMFIVIGDKARDQVPILYDMLFKTTRTRPAVLWCYKTKDEAISSYGKKRAKKIQAGKIDVNKADLFDTFRVSARIHGRYYSETHTVLGKTYGVCVLQDFEALTPNIMARTIETVEGGGLIILLLKSITSLKQLYTMSMDVHKRYRTEAHQTVTCRFNERFILSLANCKRCLVVNDELNVLPISSKTIEVKSVTVGKDMNSANKELLREFNETLRDTPPAGSLVDLCKTYDQAKAVARFIDVLAEKQLKPPTSLTAARGRGKSAAMGLAIAAAISIGYVNVYVTSPHPENLITLFEFILKGLDALKYDEHADYKIIRSTNPDYKKAVIRINISRQNRQTVQYISPNDTHLLNAADLLVIDEAAAIPLPLIKKMLGQYLVFMASTIHGYEGTGRSLSLKLISQLQKENRAPPPIRLEESIRYSAGDDIETWLTSLLCLDISSIPHISSGCPTPDVCHLFYVDRDALFSYHKSAEVFLHRVVSIYVSSHYKNSPNDLQMMSDAPAHHLFCLLGPVYTSEQLPEVLVVIQIALEGKISSKSVNDSLARGRKASGDLIPWNISEQYGDREFPKLSGVRIVRIATHPNYQRMGYGKRAVNLLRDYYEGKFTNLNEHDTYNERDAGMQEVEENQVDLLKEVIAPRKKIPTLLRRLTERQPERIDYIGTSFGLTLELLKFWKTQKFVPVYLSQKANDLTAEYSCIMLSTLRKAGLSKSTDEWLLLYYTDFRRRVLKLLGKAFREFSVGLSLSILDNKSASVPSEELTQTIINTYFLPHDIQRLESYTRNQIDYRLILDLTTDIATLIFQERMAGLQIDTLQKAIILGIGLQNKSVDQISSEFNMPLNQILAKFYDMMKKVSKHITTKIEGFVESTMTDENDLDKGESLEPIAKSFNEELDEDAAVIAKKQKKELKKLKKENLGEYEIKGSEADWAKALETKGDTGLVSVKSGDKRLDEEAEIERPSKKMKVDKKKKKKSSTSVI